MGAGDAPESQVDAEDFQRLVGVAGQGEAFVVGRAGEADVDDHGDQADAFEAQAQEGPGGRLTLYTAVVNSFSGGL